MVADESARQISGLGVRWRRLARFSGAARDPSRFRQTAGGRLSDELSGRGDMLIVSTKLIYVAILKSEGRQKNRAWTAVRAALKIYFEDRFPASTSRTAQ